MRWPVYSNLSVNQKTVISQTLIQTLGKAITVIGSFLVVRMISNQQGLGLEGFGSYALVTGYVAYFYLLLDFGFNAIFVQKANQQPEQQTTLLSQLLSLRLFLSLTLVFIGLGILSFLPGHVYTPAIKLAIMFSLATVVLQGLFMTSNGYFQLTLKYQISVIIAVLAAAVNLALTFIALRLGVGLSGVLFAYVAEFVVLGAVSIIVVRRYVAWRIVIDWQAWKNMVVEALPLGLSIVLTLIYFRSDTFLLSVLPLDASLGVTNRQAVALYSLPYAFFEVFLTLPAFITNAAYPLMLQAYAKGLDSLKRFMWQTIIGSLLAVGALMIVVWFLAPLAINLQTDYNPDFAPAVTTLRLLLLALPTFFVTNVLVFTLITIGRKKWLPAVYLLAGVFNVAANLWLIPRYGTVAAAITTGATELLILLLLAGLTWLAFGQLNSSKDQSQAEAAI